MKTNKELLEEFLAKGGKIQKIPTVPYEKTHAIGSTAKKVPELKTLAEGELLYGENRKLKKKKKKPDYSDINMDLIPNHIKKLINYNKKEDKIETNKDSRSSEASDKS